MATMPVVVSGCSSGAISAAMLSSAVGGGGRTSTGIGFASWPGGDVGTTTPEPDPGSFGLLSSLPRSCSTSAARSSVPLVAAVPRRDLIFSRMVYW